MGTFSDSKISKARQPYICPFSHRIEKGDSYLRYKLGQRHDVCVCLTHAVENKADYDCSALREHIESCKGISLDSPREMV